MQCDTLKKHNTDALWGEELSAAVNGADQRRSEREREVAARVAEIDGQIHRHQIEMENLMSERKDLLLWTQQ